MKRTITCVALLATCLFVYAQSKPDYAKIAESIVNNSLEVQPGEVVILSGTPAELDLLGAMYVAVSKAGGQPSIEVGIPEANKKALMETPMEHLGQMPLYYLMQTKVADCFFNAGSNQDPDLFADVPEERFAASRKGSQAVIDAFRTAKFRSVSLGQTGGIPTPAYAALKGASYPDMLEMFWKSIGTDTKQMSVTGKKIAEHISAGNEVHISSEAGTDISFRIGQFPTLVNSGRCLENAQSFGPSMAFLPAGEVYTCVDPSSASGKVVVPEMTYNGQEIKNLTLVFKEGRFTEITGDKNVELIKKSMELAIGDYDVLSVLDLGINPNSHPLEGSSYKSWEMAGMITLTTGINVWAGGDVKSDIGLTFHLVNSNLSIDGKELIREGKLLNP